MVRFMLALVAVGGVLTFLGFQEMRLASAAKAEPQVITCERLGEKGPGDNAHVVMADYFLCDFAFVYEIKEGSSKYTKVWVPAVPLGGPYHRELVNVIRPDGSVPSDTPMPINVKVLVKSSRVKTDNDLIRLADADTLQGVVVNSIESLGSEERRILQKNYPGVDFSKVWIVEHGRKVGSPGVMYGMMGGGGLMVVVGLGVLAVAFKSDGPQPQAHPELAQHNLPR